MSLNLSDCEFRGPALPEPFVKGDLEAELNQRRLLPKITGTEGRELEEFWSIYRRKLSALAASGGERRVLGHVMEPLLERLGYQQLEKAPDVETREEHEDGGYLLTNEDGAKLRVWAAAFNQDLLAPSARGKAYRFSPVRVAQRVLLAVGERVGVITNGVSIIILLSDPARPDSTIAIPIEQSWKRSRVVPDSFCFLLALASPKGQAGLPDIIEKARQKQTRVTKELRVQSRQAIEGFIQAVLDNPANREWLARQDDKQRLAKDLWHEGLVVIYRLLFILKLESSDDPARAFSFASTSLWRNSLSPSTALARYARLLLDQNLESGDFLENGIRLLFKAFEEGLECTELVIKPLGGALFGAGSTPILAKLKWGERAVAWLMDRLLWTPQGRGGNRERVHYGPLDVEDLGRVYEALLELEPGISTETMCRLRRQKLEVVVPVAQGAPYRPMTEAVEEVEDDEESEEEEDDEQRPIRAARTNIQWIEEIAEGRFYLRVGLGRKASGSYYTPHSFVRFLVQETIAPQIEERSPKEDPNPLQILKLKVLDPAMGSGHFLVEACRYLGDRLYEACRLCDEKASELERKADQAKKREKEELQQMAADYRQRIIDLPDPDDELLKYLPSRAPEQADTGLSQKRAEALSRRLVATHCLYGVDKNPLAVELAKLSLWLESHAEGLPTTYLDHRLVIGDAVIGPLLHHLFTYPGTREPLDDLFNRGLRDRLSNAFSVAIEDVKAIDATVGVSLAELEAKRVLREKFETRMSPFKTLAAAWSGGVMLGRDRCDDTGYAFLVRQVLNDEQVPAQQLQARDGLQQMIRVGSGCVSDRAVSAPALPFDLTFPEVFFPEGNLEDQAGFDAVIGNPPWDAIHFRSLELLANHDIRVLSGTGARERDVLRASLLARTDIATVYSEHEQHFEWTKKAVDSLYVHQKVIIDQDLAGRQGDLFRVFLERAHQVVAPGGLIGQVVPGGFHANAGAAGVRKLYFIDMSPRALFSFLNSRKLFDISTGQTFDLIVSRRIETTLSDTFPVMFRLTDDAWLFRFRSHNEIHYPLSLLGATGEYVVPFQVKSQMDLNCLLTLKNHSRSWSEFAVEKSIRIKSTPDVLHANQDSWRFEATSAIAEPQDGEDVYSLSKRVMDEKFLLLHEKGTIDQFTDCANLPRYSVALFRMRDKAPLVDNARYFRLLLRSAIHASEPRKAVAAIISPGTLAAHSVSIDARAGAHPTWVTLYLLAISNSFCFDFYANKLVLLNLSLFILNKLRLPTTISRRAFLVHGALRLVSNHDGFAPLWREQLGETWRERGKAFAWPVLAELDSRWRVRAALDAVVAQDFGLHRDEYEYILRTFDHRGYPSAPSLCLEYFDEFAMSRPEQFAQKYDPYWDCQLNEGCPDPSIQINVPECEKVPTQGALFAGAGVSSSRRRR